MEERVHGTDYVRFRYLKYYLQQKLRLEFIRQSAEKREHLLEEMVEQSAIEEVSMGWAMRRFREWNELRVGDELPRAYFDMLGISQMALQCALGLDHEEWRTYLDKPLYPDRYSVMIIPGVYEEIPLPAGTTEEEAKQEAGAYAIEFDAGLGMGMYSCVNLAPLKTIAFWGDGTSEERYYQPKLIGKKDHYLVGPDGSQDGKTEKRLEFFQEE